MGNIANKDDGGQALKIWGDGIYIYLANGDDGLRAYGWAYENLL